MTLPDEDLKQEYTIAARSDHLWSFSGQLLVRAADTLWQRGTAARPLWDEIFQQNADGTFVNTGGDLTTEELQIFEDYGLDRIALMLLGLSLENVAKTLLIRRNPAIVGEDASLKIKTHDLVKLLRECELELNQEEEYQLTVIRDYVEWFGRYPVPLSAVGKGSPKSVPGAWLSERLGNVEDTWNIGRGILDRVLEVRDAAYRV